MRAAFTPGPWELSPNDLRGGRYYSVYIPGVDRNGDKFEPIDIHELDNGEANARLIAAAPELYEALSMTLPVIDDETRLGKQIRAVLAKARGQ